MDVSYTQARHNGGVGKMKARKIIAIILLIVAIGLLIYAWMLYRIGTPVKAFCKDKEGLFNYSNNLVNCTRYSKGGAISIG
jgi:hypothetical protein